MILPGIAAPLIEVHEGDAIVRFNPVPRIAYEKNVMPVLIAMEPPASERAELSFKSRTKASPLLSPAPFVNQFADSEFRPKDGSLSGFANVPAGRFARQALLGVLPSVGSIGGLLL